MPKSEAIRLISELKSGQGDPAGGGVGDPTERSAGDPPAVAAKSFLETLHAFSL